MALLPFLSDLLPLNEPVAPLKLVPCPECQGETECSRCGSQGQIEVCGQCLQVPEIVCGVEACSCTFPLAATSICEVCEKRPQVRDGLCEPCLVEGMRKAIEEEDPCLTRYEELKARDMTPAEVAEQIKRAEEWGWI